jgi:uracil-DNA glycosylase family 4
MTVPSAAGNADLARAAAAWLEWQAAMGAVDAVMAPGERSRPPDRPARPQDAVAEPPPQGLHPARPTGDRVLHAREIAAACRTLDDLRAALDRFEGCPLRATATRLCFADGAPDARLMIIGEAPGAEEDRTGLPFVGESGQLLDRILAAIGLDRRQVWITNTIFWRPPGNRTPTPVEVGICTAFLERQIELIDPALLLLLGGPAARAVLGVTDGPSRLRGRRLRYDARWGKSYPCRVTYHPANLFRAALNKQLVWRDVLAARLELDALLGPGALPALRPGPTAAPDAGTIQRGS